MEKMPDDPILAMTIVNVRTGRYSPIAGLDKIAKRGYFFIGGIEYQDEYVPGYRQTHLDLNIGEWVYNVERGAERTTTITNIGSIAILSGLFGNLDNIDERLILGKRLTKKLPPYYAWREVPTLYDTQGPNFAHYVRPELITHAQLHPEEVTGTVSIVKPREQAIEPIGQGLYNCFQRLQTLGVIHLSGTALFNISVEPDSFEDIDIPYLDPKDKRS